MTNVNESEHDKCFCYSMEWKWETLRTFRTLHTFWPSYTKRTLTLSSLCLKCHRKGLSQTFCACFAKKYNLPVVFCHLCFRPSPFLVIWWPARVSSKSVGMCPLFYVSRTKIFILAFSGKSIAYIVNYITWGIIALCWQKMMMFIFVIPYFFTIIKAGKGVFCCWICTICREIMHHLRNHHVHNNQ